jgi:surface antigen
MTRGYTRPLALVMLLAMVLAGCDPTTGMPGTKATVGGLGGATAGGLLAAAVGGSPAGIAAGVLLGGLVGGAIGDRLDAKDRQAANQAAVHALEQTPSGTSVAWQNPDSGHAGTVTPTRTYQTASGQYCREYQQAITIDGQQHRSYGTACRQPDGSWKIAN